MVKQFTDFPNVGIVRTGDIPVGTRDGQNAQFDFPGAGIQDVDGNFLVGWNSVGASARNYMVFNNAISGQHAGITTQGSDVNVGIYFAPKGAGGVRFSTTSTANFLYDNTGIGSVLFNFGGLFSLNGTHGVKNISNDPTLSNDSPRSLVTESAVKSYIDAHLLAFNTVSASTQALSANNSYYITYGGVCVMPLPTNIQAGEYIEVMVDSSGGKFHITQADGQEIKYGANSGASVTTGTAATGYLESRFPNTSILLKCVVSNTTFMVVNNINDCIVST